MWRLCSSTAIERRARRCLTAVWIWRSRSSETAVAAAQSVIGHRRGWRAEREAAPALAVQLERARGHPTPEAGYVELWRATLSSYPGSAQHQIS
jgi:hypothetical protein